MPNFNFSSDLTIPWGSEGGQGKNNAPSKFIRPVGGWGASGEPTSVNPSSTWSNTFPLNYIKKNAEQNAAEKTGPAKNILELLTKGSLGVNDDTGSVQLTPGGINVRSNEGWNVGLDALSKSASLGVGPFNLEGSMGVNPFIKANVNFSAPKLPFNYTSPEQQLDKQLNQFSNVEKLKAPTVNLTEEKYQDGRSFLVDYLGKKLGSVF